MDSLKFHPGLPCPTLLHLCWRATPETAVSRASSVRASFTSLDTPRRAPMHSTRRLFGWLLRHEDGKAAVRERMISFIRRSFFRFKLPAVAAETAATGATAAATACYTPSAVDFTGSFKSSIMLATTTVQLILRINRFSRILIDIKFRLDPPSAKENHP
jgi:hypothetical protein